MDSRDILFWTLALCAAILTGFTAWFLYYLVKIFRTIENTVEDFRNRLATIDTILQTIKDKISSTHMELAALTGGLRTLMQFFANRQAGRRSRPAAAGSSTRASRSEDDF